MKTSTYTTRRLSIYDFDEEMHKFLRDAVLHISKLRGHDFPGVESLSFTRIISDDYLFVCFKDAKPIGYLWGSLKTSIFTNDILILRQESFYARPGTRAAYYLMKHFLDFGKLHADHVLTAITPYTNIKPFTLEKLGFSKLETLYRWENERR